MKRIMDDEIMNVTGGHVSEIIDDSISLYNAGYMGEKFDSYLYIVTHWDHCSSAVDAGWAAAGVTSVTHPVEFDQYYLDGKEITQQEAYQHAGMPYMM